MDQFLRRWPTPASWRDSLATLTRREAAAVRRATRHDSALGSDEFLQNLERTYKIRLRALPIGLPRKGPATEVTMQVPANQSATASTLADSGFGQPLNRPSAFPSNYKSRSAIFSTL